MNLRSILCIALLSAIGQGQGFTCDSLPKPGPFARFGLYAVNKTIQGRAYIEQITAAGVPGPERYSNVSECYDDWDKAYNYGTQAQSNFTKEKSYTTYFNVSVNFMTLSESFTTVLHQYVQSNCSDRATMNETLAAVLGDFTAIWNSNAQALNLITDQFNQQDLSVTFATRLLNCTRDKISKYEAGERNATTPEEKNGYAKAVWNAQQLEAQVNVSPYLEMSATDFEAGFYRSVVNNMLLQGTVDFPALLKLLRPYPGWASCKEESKIIVDTLRAIQSIKSPLLVFMYGMCKVPHAIGVI